MHLYSTELLVSENSDLSTYHFISWQAETVNENWEVPRDFCLFLVFSEMRFFNMIHEIAFFQAGQLQIWKCLTLRCLVSASWPAVTGATWCLPHLNTLLGFPVPFPSPFLTTEILILPGLPLPLPPNITPVKLWPWVTMGKKRKWVLPALDPSYLYIRSHPHALSLGMPEIQGSFQILSSHTKEPLLPSEHS